MWFHSWVPKRRTPRVNRPRDLSRSCEIHSDSIEVPQYHLHLLSISQASNHVQFRIRGAGWKLTTLHDVRMLYYESTHRMGDIPVNSYGKDSLPCSSTFPNSQSPQHVIQVQVRFPLELSTINTFFPLLFTQNGHFTCLCLLTIFL